MLGGPEVSSLLTTPGQRLSIPQGDCGADGRHAAWDTLLRVYLALQNCMPTSDAYIPRVSSLNICPWASTWKADARA